MYNYKQLSQILHVQYNYECVTSDMISSCIIILVDMHVL